MTTADILKNYQRQVHLDFHTSPYIPDVGSEFDPEVLAETFKEAHVNSVTVFAKCHHGMCYYPTKSGVRHPAMMDRDLLGEMIEALHRRDIRCPVYMTVGWEEDAARRFPEWRQMHRDGSLAQMETSPDWHTSQPGRWKFMNWLHPEYQDYIATHIEELFANYQVDGLFFDILFFHRDACWSDTCREFRRKRGFLGFDAETQAKFNVAAQAAFMRKFTRLAQGLQSEATVYYNSAHHLMNGRWTGSNGWYKEQTHIEIESLPSGFWGYQHFPRTARFISQTGKPWLGMTGRFQKMWGDFGGIKPQPALEYECFRTQAMGGANSVGDQLPPRGKLDQAAYMLIGSVFEQCKQAESFYAGSKPLHQIGIMSPASPGCDTDKTDRSIEGAVMMCEETHYDAAVLNDTSKLSSYELVILPDSVTVSPELASALEEYYRNGGNLLLSHRAGFDIEGRWALDFIPLTPHGKVEKFPTYWRTRADFMPETSDSDRVFYQAGTNMSGGRGTRVLVDRVLPYFKRTDLRYSSHFQTPPVAKSDKFAAVLGGDRFIYFADPCFREYRQAGNVTVRNVWRTAMEKLIGPPPFGAGLPTTVLSIPRRSGQDLLLTLLHYVPVRKALDIDVIEERMSFAGEVLHVPQHVSKVFVGDTDESLECTSSGSFVLPAAKGRLLLKIPGYFSRRVSTKI
jgi:hypothetical protein